MDVMGLRGKWKEKKLFVTLLLLCVFIPTLSLPTNGKDVQCPDGDYLTDNGICCYKCPPGFKHKADCKAPSERTHCEKCANGTYMDQVNYANNCRRCSQCKENSEVVTPCHATQNTVCRCKDGFFKFKIDKITYDCVKCRTCGHGQRTILKCTHEHDTVCECQRNYYRKSNSTNRCLPCLECKDECKPHCPPEVKGTEPSTLPEYVTFAVMAASVLVVLLVFGIFISRKLKKVYGRRKHSDSTPSSDSAPSSDTTDVISSEFSSVNEGLIQKQGLSFSECSTAVSNLECANLPDCVPQEIKTSELIYTVLNQVPVRRVKELARLLGVTDIEIERAEVDHQSCKEAHYQMLRTWAERSSQAGGKDGRERVLHRPLLQELLGMLEEMHLGKAVQDLQEKYSVHCGVV